jgi:UDP-glucose:tetrahydrobiopterin glucosyltransferase
MPPSSSRPLKLLFVSTPVGPLGSGQGGGVELTILNMAQSLLDLGHHIEVMAPTGSQLNLPIPIHQVLGAVQIPAQSQSRQIPITLPPDSVLARMWQKAQQVQAQYDLIVNFAYDWLPFYLTPFFKTPVAHLVSMGSLNDAMDLVVGEVAQQFPHRIAVYTRTQAETFPFAAACYPLGSGLDLSLYEFCPQAVANPTVSLCWLGRIAPEKALEDAVAAAQQTGIPLKILGQIQDPDYWQEIQRTFPTAPIHYLGFQTTQAMQQILRECAALVVTPRWVEAFGNVLIEALACGVPVIAYARGGPTEIIRDGQTGWLVEPDSVAGLVAAIGKLDQIDRQVCRQQAEQDYSLAAYGAKIQTWLELIKNPH